MDCGELVRKDILMAKKILIFLGLLLFGLNLGFSSGSTFFSVIYGYNELKMHDFNDHASSLNSLLEGPSGNLV